MRLQVPLAALFAVFVAIDFASAKPAPASELHTFFGEVTAVDLAAKTLTLKSRGKSYVFHITRETQISSFRSHIRLEKVRPGQTAKVDMRVGDGGRGIAVSIRFDAHAGIENLLALFSVKTIQGHTISGTAFNEYVVDKPPDDSWTGGGAYEGGRMCMFLLFVRPDGTVADAKPLGTLGYPQLNERAVKWCKRWRFRPNSITEARMPMGYVRTR
jgi:hypothetical protein